MRRKHPSMIFSKRIESGSDEQQTEIDVDWRKYKKMTQKTKELLISATSYSTYFSIFLGSTKGRDKFLAFFQYTFDFYQSCAYKLENFTRLVSLSLDAIPSVRIAQNLTQNISSARKIFRLLKFLDEIKGMARIIRSNKPVSVKYLSLITYSFSFVYYLLDNAIWAVQALILSKVLPKDLDSKLKVYKNYCSLGRCLSYLVLLYEMIRLRKKKNQQKASGIWTEVHKEFCGNSLSLISGRRKNRFFFLQICVTVLRLFMLVKSLKLRGWNYFDPMFISFSGLLASCINLFKVLFQKKIVVNW